jgi:hypothetical protein
MRVEMLFSVRLPATCRVHLSARQPVRPVRGNELIARISPASRRRRRPGHVFDFIIRMVTGSRSVLRVEYRATLDSVSWTNQSIGLHLLDQPGGAVVPNTQSSLQHGGRCSSLALDYGDRLIEQWIVT